MNRITFYIVRHGKTLMNTLEKVQGWCDSPLTHEGIETARHLGYGLDKVYFRTAYCSDLRRTRQTVDIILGAKGQGDIPVIELPGLREACFGSFECDTNHHMWLCAAERLGYDSVETMYQDVLEKKVDYTLILDAIQQLDTLDMAENFNEVEARTQESLREIAVNESAQGEANILLVAHGMSILCMLHNLGGDELQKGHLQNASVCKVVYEGGQFIVQSMGDMSYVEKGRGRA